ncbi:hypothetical protein [Streptomyces sp. CT34]|uniref:hypothetical protein n=1 Tax=Streptomyces sp. CT34 TaxID=1553907 RepID=UPI0005B92F5B|nr:hypothetical protein [Streptomyces sp. CT34]
MTSLDPPGRPGARIVTPWSTAWTTYGTLTLNRGSDDTATGTFAPCGAYMVKRGQRPDVELERDDLLRDGQVPAERHGLTASPHGHRLWIDQPDASSQMNPPCRMAPSAAQSSPSKRWPTTGTLVTTVPSGDLLPESPGLCRRGQAEGEQG